MFMHARTWIGSAALLFILAAPAAWAATLAPATYEQFVANCNSPINQGTPTCSPSNPANPQPTATSGSAAMRGDNYDVTAFTSGFELGAVSVSLTAQNGDYPYGEATITYQLEILGPAASYVDLTIDADGNSSTTGDGNGYAFLMLSTDASDTTYPDGVFYNTANQSYYNSYTASACSAQDAAFAGSNICSPNGNNDFPLSATIEVAPNQVVDVTMTAFATMGNFGLCSPTSDVGCGSASFAVDPQYIPNSQYSVEYSPGISQVSGPSSTMPEPSAALLLGAGLAGLWLHRRRRSQPRP
jgi:hypothetical protein